MFMHGRDGDHVMGVYFKCDVCSFRNVNVRDVCWSSTKYLRTLCCWTDVEPNQGYSQNDIQQDEERLQGCEGGIVSRSHLSQDGKPLDGAQRRYEHCDHHASRVVEEGSVRR